MGNNFYILSTGRAGSAFIANFLDRTAGLGINLHQDKYSRKMNILGNIALHYPSLSHLLERQILKSYGNSNLPATCDPLKAIPFCVIAHKTDPEKVKIVHLVRDPRDVVASFLKWKNRKLSGIAAHHFFPFWQPTPFNAGQEGIITYLSMSKFEHFCWIWNFKNRLFDSLKKRFPNFYCARFEDIVSSETSMKRLLQFLEMEKHFDPSILKQKVNASGHSKENSWIQWEKSRAICMQKHCGDFMLNFGYGLEKEWMSKIGEV